MSVKAAAAILVERATATAVSPAAVATMHASCNLMQKHLLQY